MSLFSDDTTIFRTKEELERGFKANKEVMTSFEEKNNETKEESLVFEETSSHGIRMPGSWKNLKVDVQDRIERARHLWSRVRPRLVKS